MDTDDLSEMAWRIIVHAARVSDTLKADLGARSLRYETEDDWLRGVRKFLQEIAEEPEEYVDYWNLEEAESVTATIIGKLAAELFQRADETLTKPMAQRGKKG